MRTTNISEYFADVETVDEYSGYFFSAKAAITIAVLGTFCGLRNMKQIHQWASNDKIQEFLSEKFGIESIVCYSWFTQVLGLIKPESFNECFIRWVSDSVKISGKTLALDGKTVRSTATMRSYKKPLHIVSAQISQLGITLGQQAVDGKSNEIPAVRQLLDLLEIKGCMIVADAMHCQRETARKIIEKQGDYLLCAKDNQPDLKESIEDYVQDFELRNLMDSCSKIEKNSGRTERRTAFVTGDIDWLYGKENWANLACVGAINTQFTTKDSTSNEWHYYISNRKLTAAELLHHARCEWSVETMHWLLDVHFGEDFCRALEQRTQENLNIVRKIVLNVLRDYKNATGSKAAFTHLMLDCLIEPMRILDFLG